MRRSRTLSIAGSTVSLSWSGISRRASAVACGPRSSCRQSIQMSGILCSRAPTNARSISRRRIVPSPWWTPCSRWRRRVALSRWIAGELEDQQTTVASTQQAARETSPCYWCGENGHLARDCSEGGKGGDEKGLRGACWLCGKDSEGVPYGLEWQGKRKGRRRRREAKGERCQSGRARETRGGVKEFGPSAIRRKSPSGSGTGGKRRAQPRDRCNGLRGPPTIVLLTLQQKILETAGRGRCLEKYSDAQSPSRSVQGGEQRRPLDGRQQRGSPVDARM